MDDSTITLRAMTRGDLEAAHRLSRAVAWPHRPEDWAMLLDLGEGVVAAEAADGAVVGTAMWWPLGAGAVSLGMIIVAPSRQGRGIGRRLMDEIMEQAGDRALMLTASAEGRPLYRKLGFAEAGAICQMQGEGQQRNGATGPARSMAPDEAAEVKALDRAALGVGRDAVIARLVAAGKVYVLEGATGLSGFAIRRPFGRGEVIGPVVAPDEAGATALVDAAVRPGFTRLDVPAEATGLIRDLERRGLDVVDTVTPMVRGAWPGRCDEGVRRFALVSQALG